MEIENEAHCCPGSSSGGSREYKVVMLGAGGVGKSGKFSNAGEEGGIRIEAAV